MFHEYGTHALQTALEGIFHAKRKDRSHDTADAR